MLIATYVINKLPSKVIKKKTPYQLLFDQNRHYDHTRVFGYLVYAKENKT